MARPEARGEYAQDRRPYQGTLIREIRQSTHKTITVLAGEVGLHPASLSRIELNTARIGYAALARIAGALNTPIEDLVTAPIHPKLGILERLNKAPSLHSIGDQIDNMIAEAHMVADQRKLAEQ